MEHKRFIAHDFLIGSPILIDRAANTMTLYRKNFHGQIYNLRTPDCTLVDGKLKQGLIRRTKGSYGPHSRKVVDPHIYSYLMTPEEQAKCGSKPGESRDTKIVETDSFHDAIKAMCDWVYNYEFEGKGGTEAEKSAHMKYCEKFLQENPSPPTPTPKERNHAAR